MTLAVAMILITALAFVSAFSLIANAESDENADTYSIIFPKTHYLPSYSPSIVAANKDYLTIYDEEARTLFVQSNDHIGTYPFAIPQDVVGKVTSVSLVGKTAFIYSANGYFTLDISTQGATLKKKELSSPLNANYFRSDGDYLLAKSLNGYFTIYDENLSVAQDFDVAPDNIYNDIYLNKQVMGSQKDKIYAFPSEYGITNFSIYDVALGRETLHAPVEYSVTEAYVGDVIFAQLSEKKQPHIIVAINKTTGKTLKSSDTSPKIIPDSFCAFGSTLFTIEGKEICEYSFKTENDEYTFEKRSTRSLAGSDLFHFNNPSDVTKFGNQHVIADTLNSRISYIDAGGMSSTFYMESAPVRLTADTSGVYALQENGDILKVNGGQILQTFRSNGEKIIDLSYLDKLYFIKSDGLYTVFLDEIVKIADVDGAKRIATAKDGSLVYVMSDTALHIFSTDGVKMRTVAGNFSEVNDFAVDYAGQIITASDKTVTTYKNNYGALEKLSETELKSATSSATVSSVFLDGNELLFTAKECFLGLTSVNAYTLDTYPTGEISTSGEYYFAKLKENTVSFTLPANDRQEGLKFAPTDTVMVFNGEDESEYKLALLNGEFFKIKADDFDTVPQNAVGKEYAANKNTVAFTLPSVETGKVDIPANTRFTVVSDCADFEGGKWYAVKIGDKSYFVDKNDCDEYAEVVPEKDRVFGKAKAKRVGGIVNIYASPSSDSATVAEIVDGTRVEVLDETDEYYLVLFENKTGYMYKSQVKIGGLTTIQIATIIIVVLATVSGTFVMIAIYMTKKKGENNSEKPSKTKIKKQ